MGTTTQIRTRLGAALGGLVLLPALVVGAATGAPAATPEPTSPPAAAATVAPMVTLPPQDCSSTYACWWVDINYGGDYYGSSKDQWTWPAGIANKDSSVVNNGTSGQAIFTYNYNSWIETMYCVRKGVWVSWLGNDKQDRGQSHNWKVPDSGCL